VATQKNKDENKIIVFERKVLGRVYGPVMNNTTGE